MSAAVTKDDTVASSASGDDTAFPSDDDDDTSPHDFWAVCLVSGKQGCFFCQWGLRMALWDGFQAEKPTDYQGTSTAVSREVIGDYLDHQVQSGITLFQIEEDLWDDQRTDLVDMARARGMRPSVFILKDGVVVPTAIKIPTPAIKAARAP